MAPKTILAACALLLASMLAACSGEPSAAAPTSPSVAAILPEPFTSEPTASNATALTATPTASPRPAPTATPTTTTEATASPTATPSPTETPLRAAAAAALTDPLAQGRWQQLIGDCDQARRIFAELLAAGLNPAHAAEARYRMAQCYLRDQAYAEAWATLTELLEAAPPTDPHRAPAQFLLGEALSALASWPAAEAAYTAYLPLAPELTYLAHQRIGAARQAQGNSPGAAEAYRAALAVSPDWTNTTAIRRALAGLALEQGNFAEAVAQYDALRGGETTGAWAAEMHYLAGNALARPVQVVTAALQLVAPATTTPTTTATPIPIPTEALARWQAAVDADITSRWAHAAIVALLDAGAPVDEYQRGRANYHNQVYALAIAAFDRLRADNAARSPADTWYYAGLSHLALGNTAQGLAELDHFIANAPDDPLWGEAWLAQGRAQSRAGQTAAAIATYHKLAETRPDAAEAPVALWRAAVLQDSEPPQIAAAEAYLAFARRYPGAADAWRAYQGAGLIYFRLADWERAAATWREMAGNAELPAFSQPVAQFWLGRALLAGGDPQAAEEAWQQTQQADPYNFFALRAADWATGAADAWVRENAPRTEQSPLGQAGDDAAEITAWLRDWAAEGALVVNSLPERVLADADWQRGRTLLALGLRSPALAQWERVRTRYASDPWTMTALALAFRDAGAHRLSLLSAERVVALSGKPMQDAPAALQRLAYPLPYADLIRGEATARNLDPRLLAAIIRQESRFEGGATSVAGAQGLMQVMPGTAESIARQLRWPNFEPKQAYLPYINVAFGAFYVRQWLTHFDGSVFAALAAYNGGPGNATAWYNWAPQDDDLLAALININETRVYVQAVWANYEVYRRLYPSS